MPRIFWILIMLAMVSSIVWCRLQTISNQTQIRSTIASTGIHLEKSPKKTISPSAPAIQTYSAPEWELKFWDAASAPDWQQSELLEDVAIKIPDAEIPGVLDLLRPERSNAAHTLMTMLIERWTEKSPAEAAKWVASLPEDDANHAIFANVARQWSEQNFSDTLNWVQQLPDGGNKAAAELSLGFAAATQQQLTTAFSLIAATPSNSQRDDTFNYAVLQWAETAPDDAIDWVRQQSNTSWRETMLARITIQLASQDPSSASAFAATQLPEGDVRDSVFATVFRFWMTSAPDDASAWIAQLPASPLRDEATDDLTPIQQQ